MAARRSARCRGARRARRPRSRPPVVEYTITTSLDPETKILEARERLDWRNPSGDPVGELRFHLYLNAFKNNRSTFIRESGGQLRGDKAGDEDGGLGLDRRDVDEDGEAPT